MSREAMKQALEAYEVPLVEQLESVPNDARLVIEDADGMGTRFIPVGRMCQEAAAALRQAIANKALDRMAENERQLGIQMQPDEPVAWVEPEFWSYLERSNCGTAYRLPDGKRQPLYTRPQPTVWVGLTLEDKQEYVAQDYGGNRLDAMDWAERRLREKNT